MSSLRSVVLLYIGFANDYACFYPKGQYGFAEEGVHATRGPANKWRLVESMLAGEINTKCFLEIRIPSNTKLVSIN